MRLHRLAGVVAWTIVAAACTVALRVFYEPLDKAHMALAFLLVVLGASAMYGRVAGLILAVLCFFTFNFFLLPPFHTLALEEPLDWLILGAFLLTGAIAAQLLHRAQREAAIAQERALENERLATEAERIHTLREADRLKDALLAAVSHDLRTPLTTIKAVAHDIASDGEVRAILIEEEADRLNRFVSDLLDLSRLNAGGPVLEPELVAAEDVLGAALQQVSGSLAGRNIQASIDDAEPLLIGRFDFVQTLRALVNLISNALKYSPGNTDIDVVARREGEWIVFEVADHGPGISAVDGDRIFEPFYRGNCIIGTAGSGLGLPIARRAIEMQGGRLSYASRTGGGSVFRILLPAAGAIELEHISS